MDHQKERELIDRYLSGNCSAEERDWVDQWYIARSVQVKDEFPEPDYELVKVAMLHSIRTVAYPVRRKLLPKIAGIAAAVAAILFGIWFYTSHHLDDRRDLLNYVNDIAPGKQGATLTLANGKVIDLSSDKSGVVVGDGLRYNDGTGILRDALDDKGVQMTATTAKGQTYQFTLPDGTKVWLNAASKITFLSKFGDKFRSVSLDGEAYFEVAKNKAKPFKVKSNGQEVQVLGTHFNINSYADEGTTKTTLLEGSVRVASVLSSSAPTLSSRANAKDLNTDPSELGMTKRRNGEAVTLKPNQQATNTKGKLAIQTIDPDAVVDWKNNEFVFKDEDLRGLMRKLSRWYNVEIIYEKDAPQDLELGGWDSRDAKLSQVLKNISSTNQVHFKIEGRRLRVMK